MNSIVLKTASRFLITLLLLVSVFLLIRGHNDPGGGFVAALVAAVAVALYAFASSVDDARALLRFDPHLLMGAGILLAFASAIPAAVQGDALLTGVWRTLDLPGGSDLKLGTPLLFDLGVYLTVIGSVLAVLLTLSEKET